MKTPIALVLAASLAAGCATTGDGSLIQRRDERADARFARYEPYLGEPVSGFTAWRYDSWEPISRTQLVLRTSINNAYLLTVDGTCTNLPFAETIGVTSTGNQVTKFDSVLVRGERCLIRQIRPIDEKQMRADERAARSAAKSTPESHN